MSKIIGFGVVVVIAAVVLAEMMPTIIAVVGGVLTLVLITCGGLVALVLIAGFVLLADNLLEGRAESKRQDRWVAIAETEAQWQIADENGLYAAYRPELSSVPAGHYLELSALHQTSQRTWPSSPKMVTNENYGMLEGQEQEQPLMVPSFSEVMQLGHIPMNGILLGYDVEGNPNTVSHSDFGTTLIVGRSGTGKTTFGRFLAGQAALQNSSIYVIDPEVGSDESLIDGLGGLRIEDAATDTNSINRLCNYIAMEAQRQGRNKNDRMVIMVDEVNRLLRGDTGKALTEAIYQVAAAGRKRGVYLWAFGQSATTQHMDSQIRDLFMGIVGFPKSHDLFGNLIRATTKDILEVLPKYHVLHFPMNGGGESVAAIPNTTTADIEMIARPNDEYTVSSKPSSVPSSAPSSFHLPLLSSDSHMEDEDGSQSEDGLEDEMEDRDLTHRHIISMLKGRSTIGDILTQVLGVTSTGGGSYQRATKKVLAAIMAEANDAMTEDKYALLDSHDLMVIGALQDGQNLRAIASATAGVSAGPDYNEALENVYESIRRIIA